MPSVYYPWLRLGGYFFVFFTVTNILDFGGFVNPQTRQKETNLANWSTNFQLKRGLRGRRREAEARRLVVALAQPASVVRPVAAGDGAAYFSRSLRRASALPLAVMALAVAARLVFGVAPGYGADANHTLIIPTIGEFVNPESNPAPALPGHRPLPFLAPTPPAPAAQSRCADRLCVTISPAVGNARKLKSHNPVRGVNVAASQIARSPVVASATFCPKNAMLPRATCVRQAPFLPISNTRCPLSKKCTPRAGSIT